MASLGRQVCKCTVTLRRQPTTTCRCRARIARCRPGAGRACTDALKACTGHKSSSSAEKRNGSGSSPTGWRRRKSTSKPLALMAVSFCPDFQCLVQPLSFKSLSKPHGIQDTFVITGNPARLCKPEPLVERDGRQVVGPRLKPNVADARRACRLLQPGHQPRAQALVALGWIDGEQSQVACFVAVVHDAEAPHLVAFQYNSNIRRGVVDRLQHACCCPTPAQAKFNVVARQFGYVPGHRMHGPTKSVDVDGMVRINGKWGNNAINRVIKLPIASIIDNLTLFTCCEQSMNSLSPEYPAGLRFDTLQLATLRALG